jgi:hypothetical protein
MFDFRPFRKHSFPPFGKDRVANRMIYIKEDGTKDNRFCLTISAQVNIARINIMKPLQTRSQIRYQKEYTNRPQIRFSSIRFQTDHFRRYYSNPVADRIKSANRHLVAASNWNLCFVLLQLKFGVCIPFKLTMACQSCSKGKRVKIPIVRS